MEKEELLIMEEFAKEIVTLADSKLMTIGQLSRSLKMAEEIALHSRVSKDSIDKHDFLSAHISDEEPNLFG